MAAWGHSLTVENAPPGIIELSGHTTELYRPGEANRMLSPRSSVCRRQGALVVASAIFNNVSATKLRLF